MINCKIMMTNKNETCFKKYKSGLKIKAHVLRVYFGQSDFVNFTHCSHQENSFKLLMQDIHRNQWVMLRLTEID